MAYLTACLTAWRSTRGTLSESLEEYSGFTESLEECDALIDHLGS